MIGFDRELIRNDFVYPEFGAVEAPGEPNDFPVWFLIKERKKEKMLSLIFPKRDGIAKPIITIYGVCIRALIGFIFFNS